MLLAVKQLFLCRSLVRIGFVRLMEFESEGENGCYLRTLMVLWLEISVYESFGLFLNGLYHIRSYVFYLFYRDK